MPKKERKYFCLVCPKGFTRPTSLARHVRKKHKSYKQSEQKIRENNVSKNNVSQNNLVPEVKNQPVVVKKKAVEKEAKQESKESTNTESFKSDLNEMQRKAFELVEQGKNIFLTGSAGTGKSFLLKKIVEHLRSKYKDESKTEQELAVAVTSTTGINVTNIRGGTLHSFSGIKTYSEEPKEFLLGLASKSEPKRRWKRVKHLIIDEISMLDGNLLDKLEWISRKIRGNTQPFGGIQIILSGDFCQLPPVTKKHWLEKYTKYCFEAISWKRVVNHEIELTEIFRQKTDLPYLSLLQNLRYGNLSEVDIELIKSLSRGIEYEDGIKPVKLFATNSEADAYNKKELAKIRQLSRYYKARDWALVPIFLHRLLEMCLAPDILELKIGTRVMLIKNYPPPVDLWNGSQGVVIGFEGDYPRVKFTNGRVKVIEPHEWISEDVKKTGEKRRLASRLQVPLILSWGVTIHKSQGQTIDRLEVDCARVFAPGHIYTALSRCPASQNLQIVNFDVKKIITNERVQKYYLNLIQKNDKS